MQRVTQKIAQIDLVWQLVLRFCLTQGHGFLNLLRLRSRQHVRGALFPRLE